MTKLLFLNISSKLHPLPRDLESNQWSWDAYEDVDVHTCPVFVLCLVRHLHRCHCSLYGTTESKVFKTNRSNFEFRNQDKCNNECPNECFPLQRVAWLFHYYCGNNVGRIFKQAIENFYDSNTIVLPSDYTSHWFAMIHAMEFRQSQSLMRNQRKKTVQDRTHRTCYVCIPGQFDALAIGVWNCASFWNFHNIESKKVFCWKLQMQTMGNLI